MQFKVMRTLRVGELTSVFLSADTLSTLSEQPHSMQAFMCAQWPLFFFCLPSVAFSVTIPVFFFCLFDFVSDNRDEKYALC